MPELTLVEILLGWKYELRGPTSSEKGSLFAEISGSHLTPIDGVLRATDSICNIGVVIGIFDAVPQRSRYTLLLSLLELDWEHPLARISMVNTPVPAASAEKGTDNAVRVIIAETTFFWKSVTKEHFDSRMTALNAIAFAASQHLAARASLSNTNPFYDKLKGGASPVLREDFFDSSTT